jgi:hypothetical protein
MAAKTAPDPELITLVYNEAMRALSEQSSALDGLRTRAGLILTAASIASSFLGGLALQQARPRDLVVAGDWIVRYRRGVGFRHPLALPLVFQLRSP